MYLMENILNRVEVRASAPVRVDMGGTLDLPSYGFLLRPYQPRTFNLALDCRTTIVLKPYREGMVKVSSTGLGETEFPAGEAPYNHGLGVMFAVADYFCLSGLHIMIESASPPKSGLGGSSSACVALVAAISGALEHSGLGERLSIMQIAETAHNIEQAATHESCGIQDQLAAAFGGVNIWSWNVEPTHPRFIRQPLSDEKVINGLNERLLVAFCGIQHQSGIINRQWVSHFIAGKDRRIWHEIAELTAGFIKAISNGDYDAAIAAMNQETMIRLKLTPDVLDETGAKLLSLALAHKAGARFTGAGCGGCVWALCPPLMISELRKSWQAVLSAGNNAFMVEAGIDRYGVEYTVNCS